VLELVEGPTLADRIAHGPIALDEALPIARQIAEALEAAHEHSIIHRDLKPANIKVRADGAVKVLDFGLAKALGDDLGGDLSNSPTISLAATRAGVILGTAAYMSPEQAKGRPVDKRSDVWAFGCVLYEMLTGKRAFDGDDVSDTLAAVLRGAPEWTALPADVPPLIRILLQRCLEKDRRQRIADISTALFVMKELREMPADLTESTAAPRPLWRRAIPILVTAIVVAAVTGAAVWNLRSPAPPTVSRSRFILPEGHQFTNPGRLMVAISPDGTQMVYVANNRLYLRSLGELEARPIPGTEIAQGPVWNPVFSPDGGSVAYMTLSGGTTTIHRIAVGGGTPVTVSRLASTSGSVGYPNGMSWSTDGILFDEASRIMRVSADGGTPELLVSVKNNEEAHGPRMLPGGQAVLFTLAAGTGASRWDQAHIVVHSLASGERKTLIEGASDARYLPTGHIVYALGGALFAVPFDERRLEVTGGAVPIVEGVRRAAGGGTGVAHFSVSDTGSLIFIPGPVASTSVARGALALIDRNGDAEPLKLPAGTYESPRVSPDGRHVAYATDDGKDAIVWIYELSGTSVPRRLTFGGRNRFPIWSADGQRIAFQSDRDGDLGIFWQRADGTGTAERLTKPDQGTAHVPEAWSPTGERFSFSLIKESDVSLWMFSLPDKKAAPFGEVRSADLLNSAFSPDGRWVAYVLPNISADGPARDRRKRFRRGSRNNTETLHRAINSTTCHSEMLLDVTP